MCTGCGSRDGQNYDISVSDSIAEYSSKPATYNRGKDFLLWLSLIVAILTFLRGSK